MYYFLHHLYLLSKLQDFHKLIQTYNFILREREENKNIKRKQNQGVGFSWGGF